MAKEIDNIDEKEERDDKDMQEYVDEQRGVKGYEGVPRIDALDRKILKLIMGNARIAFLEVARMCGVSGAAIHQRVQRLINIGVIKGSEFILSPTKIGYQTCAFIGVFLKEAGSFNQVVSEMERYPRLWSVTTPRVATPSLLRYMP